MKGLLLLLLLLVSAERMLSFVSRTRVVKPTITKLKLFSLFSYANKDLDIRPSIDDVEKISYGQKAKKRGVGSRGVPHRLNQEERLEWDLAKKRGYLVLKGTGFRKERQDSPLGKLCHSNRRSNRHSNHSITLIILIPITTILIPITIIIHIIHIILIIHIM